MVETKIRILGIAPYEGMHTVMDRAFLLGAEPGRHPGDRKALGMPGLSKSVRGF